MSLKARIFWTIGLAVLLALATWIELTSRGSSSDSDHVLLVGPAIAILIAIAVGRWWLIAALVGPALVMLVLEVTGYYTHAYLEWGGRPLFSPPGFAMLLWQGLVIAIGVGLSKGVAAFSSRRRRGEGRRPRGRPARGRPAGR
jgi:hypothetical protein